MIPVLMLILACSMSMSDAGLYTVTDEAWFKVVVLDLNGPGKNFTGRFEIALFGETVPMTVMNFVAITRGYERPNQVRLYSSAGVMYELKITVSVLSYLKTSLSILKRSSENTELIA